MPTPETPAADAAPRAQRGMEPVKYRIAGTAHDYNAVYVEERSQRDGTQLWAVTRGSSVLAADGDWEWEPQPSSRDEAFTRRTRYATAAEAFAMYQRTIGEAAHADA